MNEETNEIRVLRKKSTETEEDRIAFLGYGMLFCAAEPYIYDKLLGLRAKDKYEYDITARAIDAALGLMHMCTKAIISDRSHTIQDLINEYYYFLKFTGNKNPFTDEYTTDIPDNKE